MPASKFFAHYSWPWLRRLSAELGLTSSGSIDDLRLVIEGKITELGREPCNVQVLFEEHTSEAAFTLVDDSGEFLTVSAVETELPMLLEDGEVNSDPKTSRLKVK